jgi:hypothetical protein
MKHKHDADEQASRTWHQISPVSSDSSLLFCSTVKSGNAQGDWQSGNVGAAAAKPGIVPFAFSMFNLSTKLALLSLL